MPTRYSHSADTLCLSIRALRLSGEEASAHSGSFLSPGAARRTHVGWSYVRENRGPGEPWRLTFLPRVSPAFQTHLEDQYCDLHCGSEFSVAATQKGWRLSVWLTHTAHLLKWCSVPLLDRRGESGIWAGASALLQPLPKPEWKCTGCQLPHTRGTLPASFLRLCWFSTSQTAKHFHVHQLILASWLYEISKAHVSNQYHSTDEKRCSRKVIMSRMDSLRLSS